ncbi:polysaccharide biosynthesis protein [Ekhidna sp.]|uniref:polysaccharide biosynthesis protein n=1 Tax=Ekhidna sp. TaxID=2608089 RepID=UPI003CCBF725
MDRLVYLKNKKIAILGGSGTLGRALVRELLNEEVGRILIFSRDEIKQLEMMEEFPSDNFHMLDFKLGDVRDLPRLKEVLGGYDYVIHAAAIKHVVMAEKNPEECHKTNVLGTQNVIEACKVNNITRAILISTDKAVNPIGVYGKSKQEAEQRWLNANTEDECQFNVVRLGNIIGARGSVFEAFAKQRKNGVIKVTHPEATRFCITQKDAAQFVIQSLATDFKQIFTPEMEAFRVVDLAKEIAPECEIAFVGLRPGDKLHEEVNGVSSSLVVENVIYGS